MLFSLSACPGYVPPERSHRLSKKSPLSGLKWQQRGTDLQGRTLVSQCSVETSRGQRCRNSTTFDYRYCHRHLREIFALGVFPTSVPGLRGYGLYAVDPVEFERLGLDSQRRPVQNTECCVFKFHQLIGGRHCVFVGELISDQESERRYPFPVGGDYVIGDNDDTIDGQVGRTILQYSNDAINLNDRERRRNRPDNICMRDWPVVQNAEGIEIGRGHTGLLALTDIFHGQEIFWNYSGDDPSADTDYWSAPNH